MSATSPMVATSPILSPIASKRVTAYSPRMDTYITDQSIDIRFDHRNRTVGKMQTGNNILNRTLGSPEMQGELKDNAYTAMAIQKKHGHSTKSYINARYK